MTIDIQKETTAMTIDIQKVMTAMTIDCMLFDANGRLSMLPHSHASEWECIG